MPRGKRSDKSTLAGGLTGPLARRLTGPLAGRLARLLSAGACVVILGTGLAWFPYAQPAAAAADAPLRLALPGSPTETGMVTGSGGIFGRAVVGDDSRLSRLAVDNRKSPETANLLTELENSLKSLRLSDPEVWKGKTRIELGTIGNTVLFSRVRNSDLTLGSAGLTLSRQVEFSVARTSLYDRVVSDTNRLFSGRLELAGVPLVNEAHRLSQTVETGGLETKLMTDVAGVKLSANVALPTEPSPLLAAMDPARALAEGSPGYDLRAEAKVDKLALSASYRLVDLDDIAENQGSRTSIGVSGALAVNEAATLKVGYGLTRSKRDETGLGALADAGLDIRLTPRAEASASYRVERGPGTSENSNRATLGLGYSLADNAILKATYQLIDFGSTDPAKTRSFTSAELKIKF